MPYSVAYDAASISSRKRGKMGCINATHHHTELPYIMAAHSGLPRGSPPHRRARITFAMPNADARSLEPWRVRPVVAGNCLVDGVHRATWNTLFVEAFDDRLAHPLMGGRIDDNHQILTMTRSRLYVAVFWLLI
ncbi:hypothetical protein [Candidatus Enterovibrio escicola]|nr:hypothetical protein [Candidatus Enterovibrio escacola]